MKEQKWKYSSREKKEMQERHKQHSEELLNKGIIENTDK
jgi:hypothetical protein